MSPTTQTAVTIRPAVPGDAPLCGKICYDAFAAINAAHGFPCDFPSPEVSTGLLAMVFSTPGYYCVVAEHNGRAVGSNCLSEHSMIHGIGPITVDPAAQNLGVGRRL